MREYVIYALVGLSALLVVVWLRSVFRGGSDDKNVTTNSGEGKAKRVWILLQGSSEPEFQFAQRDNELHGYKVGEAFFADEFLKPLPADGYMLATHVMMPADGDLSHGGAYEDVKPVSQLQWTAAWTDYDQARRRLNWQMVWQRGNGSSAGLKNFAMACLVVSAMYSAWGTWGLRGQVNRIGDSAVILSAQIAKVAPSPNSKAPNQKDGSLVPDPQPAVAPEVSKGE